MTPKNATRRRPQRTNRTALLTATILFFLCGKGLADEPHRIESVTSDGKFRKLVIIDYPAEGKQVRTQKKDCYQYAGWRWMKLPSSFVINPSNTVGLAESFISATVQAAAGTWNEAAKIDIFGQYEIDYSAAYGQQDGRNVVAFGSYPNPAVLAVASIWGSSDGVEIMEFDILFNTDFDWSDALVDAGVFDLQGIATHEFGHALGLEDIYNPD